MEVKNHTNVHDKQQNDNLEIIIYDSTEDISFMEFLNINTKTSNSVKLCVECWAFVKHYYRNRHVHNLLLPSHFKPSLWRNLLEKQNKIIFIDNKFCYQKPSDKIKPEFITKYENVQRSLEKENSLSK